MSGDSINGAWRGVFADDAIAEIPPKRQCCEGSTSLVNQLVPTLQTGLDLFCTTCGCLIYACVLRKAKNCPKGHVVKLRNSVDGMYTLCARCDVVITRDMHYCYRCRRPNTDYSRHAREEMHASMHEWCAGQKPSYNNLSAMYCTQPATRNVRAAAGPLKGVSTTAPGDGLNFQTGLDLYCSHCGQNIPIMLLDKPNLLRCEHELPLLEGRDWLYRRCDNCHVLISDEMQYCYRCALRNRFYAKLARQLYSSELVKEFHRKKKEVPDESDVFSQDILSDVDLIAMAEDVEDNTGEQKDLVKPVAKATNSGVVVNRGIREIMQSTGSTYTSSGEKPWSQDSLFSSGTNNGERDFEDVIRDSQAENGRKTFCNMDTDIEMESVADPEALINDNSSPHESSETSIKSFSTSNDSEAEFSTPISARTREFLNRVK